MAESKMNDGQPTGRARWFLPAGVFGLVLVAQVWLVAVAGTDIPFQDQWDAEGRGLYPALLDGTARTADLFRPHNEHRIFWTRLLNLGLFSLNGQWDPLVQLTAGALLHAAVAALLAVGLKRSGSAGWLLGSVVVLFSLPLAGWHNALWGFQSQVYFAVFFSLAAFALMAAPAVSTGRAIAGWLAAGAAMLAMGPGLLVPVALAGGLVLSWREGRARARDAVAVAVLLAVAWALHQPVAAHAELAAGLPGQFFSALGRLLAWPHSGQPWAAVVLNLPVAVVLGRRLRLRRATVAGEDFVLLLAGWALVVALAAAWTRGGGAEFAASVPSRYVDFILLLPLANGWCVLALAREALPRWPVSGRFVAGAWGAFLLLGWLGLSAEVLRGVILPRARDREAPVRLMQEFQRTGDDAVFAGQPRLLVPHPNLEAVRAVLRDPRMQGALPPSLQPDRPVGPLSRGVRALLGR
jgi:hypothetical protein